MLSTNKRRRRRSRRRRPSVAWFRGFKGRLLNTCISVVRRYRGCWIGGYHVVRVLRAKVDRRKGEVVLVVVRMYGGDEHANAGFNGPILRLDDRREFVGPCRGLVVGREFVPVDRAYAEAMCQRRGRRAADPPSPNAARTPAAAGRAS